MSFSHGLIVLSLLANLFLLVRYQIKQRTRPKPFTWSGSTVLITGASSGIGRAFTDKISEPNYKVKKVILCGRSEKSLEVVKKAVQAMNKDVVVEIVVVDLSNPRDCLAKLKPSLKDVDVFFNNAGLSQRAEFRTMQYDSCEYIMNVNTNSPIAICTDLINNMIERNRGLIINTLSIAGLLPNPVRTMYCASKFALSGFMQALRSEVTQNDIQVVNVYPHYVRTNCSSNAMTGSGALFGKLDYNIRNGLRPEVVIDTIMEGVEYGENEIVVAPFWLRLSLPLLRLSSTLTDFVMRRQFQKQLATMAEAKED